MELNNSEKIQVVINTLEKLVISPVLDNVSKLTGIYNLLYQVRDDLANQEAKDKSEETPAEVEEDAGETDSE